MVDYYQYGSSNRLSPEAPIPVVNLESEVVVPGGAGNVAMNLKSLGANITCLSCVGDDFWGDKLISILNENKICTKNIERRKGHITTFKQRVYCDDKQYSRIDNELFLENWKPKIKINYSNYDLIILSDYNKGIFSKNWFSPPEKINVIIDPKNINNHILNSSNIMTPNLDELSKISGQKIESSNSIVRAAKKLLVLYNMDFIIATRGADGLSIIGNDNYVEHIKPHSVNDPDVTGAGDTIVAVFSLVYTITKNVEHAATIANSAAASVVSQKGTTVVKFEDLERFF